MQQQVDRLLSRYPIRRNALLPLLHMAQKENQGWLDSKWLNHVAKICEVSPTHVEGVATFYTMFRFRPPGKYHLQVCTCVPCCLVGGPEILEHLENLKNKSHPNQRHMRNHQTSLVNLAKPNRTEPKTNLIHLPG